MHDVISRAIASRRVARGAAFLDRVEPGWHERINLNTLKLDSCLDCVLGQLNAQSGGPGLYSAYFVKRQQLGLTVNAAAEHGFTVNRALVGYSEQEAQFELLTAAWRELIEARREQPIEAPRELALAGA